MDKVTLISICDVSGSMGGTKKKMAREYLGFVRATLEVKYGEVEEKYIAHSEKAKEVRSIDELFYRNEFCGTNLSSGLEKAIEIAKGVNSYESDLVIIQFSDGDNWGDDNDKTVKLMKELDSIADYMQFVEIRLSTYTSMIGKRIKENNSPSFNYVHIKTRNELAKQFLETRETLYSLEGKNEEIRRRDIERKYYHEDVERIVRNGRNTTVTLEDGSTGVSTCHPDDEYNEEIGFKAAYLRAKIESCNSKLNEMINPRTFVKVIDWGRQYTTFSELANKYINDSLWFDCGYEINNGEKLEIIEYTKHLYDTSVDIAVCKDKENRIILINVKGIEVVK